MVKTLVSMARKVGSIAEKTPLRRAAVRSREAPLLFGGDAERVSQGFLLLSLLPVILIPFRPTLGVFAAIVSVNLYYSVYPAVIGYLASLKRKPYILHAYQALQYFLLGLTHKVSYGVLLVAKSRIPAYSRDFKRIYWKSNVKGVPIKRAILSYARKLHMLAGFMASALRGVITNPEKSRVYEEMVEMAFKEKLETMESTMNTRIHIFTMTLTMYMVVIIAGFMVGSLSSTGMLAFSIILLVTTSAGLFHMLFPEKSLLSGGAPAEKAKEAAGIMYTSASYIKAGLSPVQAVMKAAAEAKPELQAEVSRVKASTMTEKQILRRIARDAGLGGVLGLMLRDTRPELLAERLQRIGDVLSMEYKLRRQLEEIRRTAKFSVRIVTALFSLVAVAFAYLTSRMGISFLGGRPTLMPAVGLLLVTVNTVWLSYVLLRDKYYVTVPPTIYLVAARIVGVI